MEENIYIKIGQTIKSLRNKNNMTLTQFGNIVGVSAAAVSKWESGEGIKTESLMKISNYFNIIQDNAAPLRPLVHDRAPLILPASPVQALSY